MDDCASHRRTELASHYKKLSAVLSHPVIGVAPNAACMDGSVHSTPSTSSPPAPPPIPY